MGQVRTARRRRPRAHPPPAAEPRRCVIVVARPNGRNLRKLSCAVVRVWLLVRLVRRGQGAIGGPRGCWPCGKQGAPRRASTPDAPLCPDLKIGGIPGAEHDRGQFRRSFARKLSTIMKQPAQGAPPKPPGTWARGHNDEMPHRRGSARYPERRRTGRAGPAGLTVLTVLHGAHGARRDPAAAGVRRDDAQAYAPGRAPARQDLGTHPNEGLRRGGVTGRAAEAGRPQFQEAPSLEL